MTVPASYRVVADRYRRFIPEEGGLDFSEAALLKAYAYETYGQGGGGPTIFSTSSNGYLLGKRWQDVQLAAWKDDIERGLLMKAELFDDPAWQQDQDWLHAQLDDVVAGSMGWAYAGRVLRP